MKEEPQLWIVLAELGCVLLLCAGIGVIFWPAALIVAGIAGIVTAEKASADRPAQPSGRKR